MKYLVTGSRVFGPATEESDLDIVLLTEDAQALRDWCCDHNLPVTRTTAQDQYDAGFYVDFGGIQINIVEAFDEDDFQAWEETTQHLKKFPPITDRESRIAIFRDIHAKSFSKLLKGGDES